MRLRFLRWLVPLALVGACSTDPAPATDPQVSALTKRVDQLEKRLAAIESVGPLVEKLRSDIAELGHRLSATSTATPPAASAPPPSGPTAAAPRTAPPGPGQRARDHRAELQDLNAEFADKRRAIRAEYGDVPSPERREAMQDAIRWFRDRRREILSQP